MTFALLFHLSSILSKPSLPLLNTQLAMHSKRTLDMVSLPNMAFMSLSQHYYIEEHWDAIRPVASYFIGLLQNGDKQFRQQALYALADCTKYGKPLLVIIITALILVYR
jgi:hypothetical protein